MNDTRAELLEYTRTLKTFDSHEHLVPEAERLTGRNDFTLFLQMYVRSDLQTAGMDPGECSRALDDPGLSEDGRFSMLQPYLALLGQSSYYRAARIALKSIYGFDGITRDNYRAIGGALRQASTPGLYRRVLKDRCNLGYIVNQKVFLHEEGGLFRCNCHVGFYHGPTREEMAARFREQEVEADVRDVESFEAALEELFATWRRKNMLALKMGVREMAIPSRQAADEIVRKMAREGSVSADEGDRLQQFVMDFFLAKAREFGYVMAVHTGPTAGCGNDFRRVSPGHLIPWARRYPDVRFDMYHAGVPSIRQAGFVAKAFPNVTANLCWAHVVAPRMVVEGVDEWLDFLPANKIIGFGGDYSPCVEKVYGALEISRANLAEVMARRIERGEMGIDEAKFLLKRILVDNGEELYGVAGS